ATDRMQAQCDAAETLQSPLRHSSPLTTARYINRAQQLNPAVANLVVPNVMKPVAAGSDSIDLAERLTLILFGRIEFEHLVRNLLVDGWIVGRCLLSAQVVELPLFVDPSHEVQLLVNPKRNW